MGYLQLAVCCSLVQQNPKDGNQLKNKYGEHSCEASRMWLHLLFGDLILFGENNLTVKVNWFL